MSLGFEQAGYDVLAAAELDPVHAATHEFNFPRSTMFCADVRDLDGQSIRTESGAGDAEIAAVVGGAPAKDFSLIGKRALEPPSSELASRRFRNTPTRDTPAELALRRELFGRGFRYRVDTRPLPAVNRRADLVFRRQRVAVFVDGCYWHGCPEHCKMPKSNKGWWAQKIGGNRARDEDTDCKLREAGWVPVRIWEHQLPEEAAAFVANVLAARTAT